MMKLLKILKELSVWQRVGTQKILLLSWKPYLILANTSASYLTSDIFGLLTCKTVHNENVNGYFHYVKFHTTRTDCKKTSSVIGFDVRSPLKMPCDSMHNNSYVFMVHFISMIPHAMPPFINVSM